MLPTAFSERYKVMKNNVTGAILALLTLASINLKAEGTEQETGQPGWSVRHENYQAPDMNTLRTLETVFSDFLDITAGPQVTVPTFGNGFTLLRSDSGIYLLSDGEKRGWGHFLLAPRRSSTLLLQAPHQFHDLRTGQIAVALFERGVGKALALNSTHRYRFGKDTPRADWAHHPLSPLNAFTRAFLAHYRQGTVVQLHGYAEKKRDSSVARQSDVILSSGQRWPQPGMLKLAQCLTDNTDWQILRYPLDVGELGGTTNVQGRLMASLGNLRFIHLELSANLRQTLIADSTTINPLVQCLAGLTSEAE